MIGSPIQRCVFETYIHACICAYAVQQYLYNEQTERAVKDQLIANLKQKLKDAEER
jgi:hypothetical protein